MTAKPFPSDATLRLYLERDLPAGELAELDNRLATDPALERHLMGLDRAFAGLAGDADRLFDQAPAAPDLRPAQRDSGPARQWLALAASLILGVAVGGLTVWSAEPDRRPDVVQAVVDYQRLYVPETLAGLPPPDAASLAMLDQFGRDHGLDLRAVPVLAAASFRRAQILGFEGNPLLQMTFADSSGQPVALCITQSGAADSAPVWNTDGAMEVVSWTEGGNQFVLVGPTSRAVLQAVLTEFSA